MSSIDKRIVQMQFDNQNFESGVKTTMSTLQRLNEKLKMKGATGGLDDVNKGISKLSSSGISGLASGVETVTSKFSALSVIGMTALANITNSAVNAGKNIVKALTIDPVMTGFSEYETKMGAIQTILTNTAHEGTTLKQVTGALDDLNTYADKTIYNFAEMTKNIGTFTAAGVDLDTSVASIKGIANLAAASGSTSQQASTAMYQLSQALAAGKVSLMDWNSVVNAGMGGKLFQDALIRTSEVLGTGAESMIEKYGSFRESLTKGEWLTSEVLTETLKQLSGAYTEADLIAQGFSKSQAQQIVELANNATAAATEVKTITQLFDTMKESVQSGWAQSWEWIIGDKDQATKLLTGISDAFNNLMGPSTEARNNMLKFWNEAGGRDDVIKGLGNIFTSLGKGLGAIGDAWKEVFPSMTGEKLVELSSKFKDFTEKIKMNDEVAGKIKDTFKGVFNVFKTVGQVVGGAVKAFVPLLGVFKPIGSMVLDAVSSLGRFTTNIANAINKSQIFTKIGEGIGNVFKSIGNYVGNAVDAIGDFISKLDFSGVGDILSGALSGIGGFIGVIGDGIGKALGSINFDTLINLGKSLVGLGIFKTLKGIFDEFKGFGTSVSDAFAPFKQIGKDIAGILGDVRNSLSSWQNSLNAKTLLTLAGAIAILAGSLVLLSTIDTGRLAVALAGMGVLFGELALAMLAIQKVGSIKGLNSTALGLILMSTAMLILSSALKTLSGLSIGEMVTGLTGMAGMLAVMAASVKMFSKSSSGLAKTSASLIIFGAAMHVMASALDKLGSIDAETMGSGLFALAGLLVELSAFLAVSKFGGLSVSSASGILILSAALVVLSQAVKSFGNLNPEQIIKGLVGIAGILAEIAVFSKLSGSGVGMIATGAGLTVMSAALMVMSMALKSLGSIQWEEMARGLVAMAGGLTILGVASALISGGQLALLGVGIGVMSAALLLLSAALQSMGSMSWEEIGKGLVALAGSLTILAVAMYAMSGAILGAAAMVVVAAALALLTPQLILLGQMDLAGVGIMLLALAGAFTVLGVAGLVLSPLLPVLLGLAGVIALLGVGCLAAGAGLALVGTGIGAIGVAVGSSGLLIVEFLRQLIQLLPEMGLKAAEGFANFMGALATAVPQLTAGFTAIISSLIAAMTTLIPEIVNLAVTFVTEFCNGLATAIPQIVDAGLRLILGLLEGISSNIQQIVEAGADCIVNFLNGISNKLGEVIDAGINLALSFIEGVADGISNNKDRLESAVRKAIEAMIDAAIAVITGAYSALTTKGRELLESFIKGIKEKFGAAKQAVSDAVDKAKEGAANCASKLIQAGRDLIEGFKKGILEKAESVANAARSVAEKAVNGVKSFLGIASPSKVFIGIGKWVDEGFVNGLNAWSGKVNNASTNLANGVINNVKNPLSNLAKIMDGEIDSTPVIAPVMDLSNVQAGARRLGGMLQDGTIQINTKSGRLAGSIGSIQNGSGNGEVVSALKDLKDSLANTGGSSYVINGITYDDGSNIRDAIETLIRAAKIERRM